MANRSFAQMMAGGWKNLSYVPFRDGIDVHWIEQGAAGEPSLAILRYAPGAAVPRHRHDGLETIIVLDGVQSDENGNYGVGTLILNPVGTEHSVWTKDGCTVLVQWDRPVAFIGERA